VVGYWLGQGGGDIGAGVDSEPGEDLADVELDSLEADATGAT
jgi:hypothetical protein